MFGLLKRFRDLLLVAALFVVPLAAYFAHARHPSERSRLDRFVLTLTAPLERGIAWAVVGALDGWRGYVALRGAHERAVELSRRVNGLELERLEAGRLRAENERLTKLLAFAQEKPGFEVVGARIVGVRLDPKGLQLVTLDRGAEDGLERMMPVVVAHGVVGRVHSLTPKTADVLLLADRNSSIAARVERSRARANVRGTGDPDVCRLDYALRSDDLIEGDVLVTSGTDGVFPRGLPVGKVTNLKRSGQGLYQKADVVPAVDVTKLEEVLVITSRPREREEEPVAAKGPTPADAAQHAKPAAPKPAPEVAKPAPEVAKPAPKPAPEVALPVKPGAPPTASAASAPPGHTP